MVQETVSEAERGKLNSGVLVLMTMITYLAQA